MLQGPCSRTDEHPAAIKPQPAERPHTSTEGKLSANRVRQLALERLNVSCLLRLEKDTAASSTWTLCPKQRKFRCLI
jgi:hypothetical protein